MRLVLWTWGSSSATATYTFWMFRDDSKQTIGVSRKEESPCGSPYKKALRMSGCENYTVGGQGHEHRWLSWSFGEVSRTIPAQFP